MPGLTPAEYGAAMEGGRRRKGVPVKTLKKMLKKAGLKVSGKKATLTRRAKKAHLKMGGGDETMGATDAGEPVAPVIPAGEEKKGGRGRRGSSKGARRQ